MGNYRIMHERKKHISDFTEQQLVYMFPFSPHSLHDFIFTLIW
jgi:hypothetical protein